MVNRQTTQDTSVGSGLWSSFIDAHRESGSIRFQLFEHAGIQC
jgi:hypothetical protein